MNPDEVRAAALARLSPHADPRGREALEHGEAQISPHGGSWTSERGPVVGLRVGLGLEPALLGALSHAHAVKDEIVAALASAVAEDGGHALTDMVLFWSPARAAATSPYRGTVDPADLSTAVEQFLRGQGETRAAAWAASARFEVRGDGVHAVPFPAAPDAAVVDGAIRALLAGNGGQAVGLRRG